MIKTMDRKGSALLIVLIVILAILVVGTVWYWQAHRSSHQANSNPSVTVNTVASTTAISQTPQSSTATSSNAVSGDTYNLFSASYEGGPGQIESEQDDGLINSGAYAGYHRIVVGVANLDFSYYVFATKDYKTFIFDSNVDPNDMDPTSASDLAMFNPATVVGTGSFPSNFPTSITEGNFVLLKEDPYSSQLASGSIAFSAGVSNLNFFTEPLTTMNSSTEYN